MRKLTGRAGGGGGGKGAEYETGSKQDLLGDDTEHESTRHSIQGTLNTGMYSYPFPPPISTSGG